MTATIVVLAIALLVALALCGYLSLQLRKARTDAEALRAAILRRDSTRAPRPVKAASKVVSAMVETATRVRERGVSGMLLASIEDFTRWATADRAQIARIAGPDGTLTIFFSDIEGSTALNNELGDERWVRLLAAHDGVVERALERTAGHVVKTQGDGHMVVFATPDLALDAALAIHEGLAGARGGPLRRTPVSVRIGVHTGRVIEKNGDFFGQNVAMAARIAARAHGGEVLVSEAVTELAAETYSFDEAGTVTLKGFEGEYPLFRLDA